MRLSRLAPALALALLASCSGTDPIASLAGVWSVKAYSSDGVTATSATGSANFAASGTVTFTNVIIVWPAGQPPDTINSSATWSQSGATLTLTDPQDTSQWSISFSGNQVVLQLLNDASASKLTLEH